MNREIEEGDFAALEKDGKTTLYLIDKDPRTTLPNIEVINMLDPTEHRTIRKIG